MHIIDARCSDGSEKALTLNTKSRINASYFSSAFINFKEVVFSESGSTVARRKIATII